MIRGPCITSAARASRESEVQNDRRHYMRGFEQGLAAAITLTDGCSPDRLATVLRPIRPDRPAGYCDLLAEIRRELGTDSIGDADD